MSAALDFLRTILRIQNANASHRRPKPRRARSLPPKSRKDAYWWLEQALDAADGSGHPLWLLKKWGYRPLVTRDGRKKPLRDRMWAVTWLARQRELEIAKLRRQKLRIVRLGSDSALAEPLHSSETERHRGPVLPPAPLARARTPGECTQ
jgi:hypothetical protein